MMQELLATKTVDGEAVGFSGQPGEFYKLSQVFLMAGRPEDFRPLAEDSNPIVRAMGMLCLAQTDAAGALPLLRSRLTVERSFPFRPYGCVGSTITEGELAWTLLHDRRPLEYDKNEPMLSPTELLELDLEVLADDRCWQYSWKVKNADAEAMKNKRLPETIQELSETMKSSPSWVLIKGLGRLQQPKSTRSLLCKAARDQRLADEIRLAALSALTRDADFDLAGFLNRNSGPSLDSIPGFDRLALVARRKERLDLDSLFAEYKKTIDTSDEPNSELAIEKTFRIDAPLALDHLRWAASRNIVDDDPAVGSSWGACVSRLFERLHEVAHCWDTDSDSLYQAAAMLQHNDSESSLSQLLHKYIRNSDLERWERESNKLKLRVEAEAQRLANNRP